MKRLLFAAALSVCAIFMMADNAKMSPATRLYLMGNTSALNEEAPLVRPMNVNGVDYISAYIHFTEAINLDLLQNLGVIVESEFPSLNIVTARIPQSQILNLSEQSEIAYVEVAGPVRSTLDKARATSFANQVIEGVTPLTQAYKGRGVIVGIADKGFEYEHLNFLDKDGNLRIKRVWEQNRSGSAPDGYDVGRELKTPAAIKSAQYDDVREDSGHGSHVAGIAAGSDKNNGNKYYGIAQESELIFVSINYNATTNIINSLKYMFDYADERNMPCVVNYSLGGHVGPHDGTSTFDKLADSLQGEGRLVVGAAGNEGGSELHVSKNLASETDTLKTMFNLGEVYGGAKSGTAAIWGEKNTDMTVTVVIYERKNGTELTKKEVFQSQPFSTADNIDTRISDFGGFATGSVKVVTTDEAFENGKPTISIEATMSNIADGRYVGFKVSGQGMVHAWTEGFYSSFTNASISGWTDGDDKYTVGEIGGVGKRIITVGAYVSNARNGYGQTVDKMATFSSEGPAADERVKPDIVAPGAVIASSVPSTSAVMRGMDKASENVVNNKKYYYAYMQGTSQATPFVTGVLATWLQADPTLTPEDVKAIFAETAIKNRYMGNSYPNNTAGNGLINAFAGIAHILGLTIDVDNTTEDVLVAYPNPTYGEFHIAFVKADKNLTLDVYNVNGQKVQSQNIGHVDAGSTQTFNIEGVDSGIYMVNIKGDSVNTSFRLVVRK